MQIKNDLVTSFLLPFSSGEKKEVAGGSIHQGNINQTDLMTTD